MIELLLRVVEGMRSAAARQDDSISIHSRPLPSSTCQQSEKKEKKETSRGGRWVIPARVFEVFLIVLDGVQGESQ